MRGAAVEIWVGACFQNLDAFHPVAFCAVDQAFDAGEFALGLDEITPTLFVDAPRLLPRCFADLRTAGSGSPGHCNATRTLFSLRPAVRMVVGSRAGACVRACGTCGTCGTCVYVRMCVSRGGWVGWVPRRWCSQYLEDKGALGGGALPHKKFAWCACARVCVPGHSKRQCHTLRQQR